MATTPNLGLTKPANGANVDTWDVPVNGNSDIIDSFAGGVTVLNATGVSGVVNLTLTQATPRIITVSGVPTGAITYKFPAIGGLWSVSNITTGGQTITFGSVGGGTTVNITAGSRAFIGSDGTNVFLADTSAAVPIGMIALWSGSVASIPTGWHLNNGVAGTINLQDQFLVGAGGSYAVGATGGITVQTSAVTVFGHTLLIGEIPIHAHPISDPGHGHGVNDGGHAHSTNDGGHAHGISGWPTGVYIGTPGAGSALAGGNTVQGYGVPTGTDLAATGIGINGNFTGIGIAGAFTGINTTQNNGGNGSHDHTASIAAWDNRPPFYALAFMQKIS